MPVEAKVYLVLIASPGDVAEERDIIRDQVFRWNAIHTADRKMVLMPIGWETNATPSLEARGQAVINRQLVDICDLHSEIKKKIYHTQTNCNDLSKRFGFCRFLCTS